MKPETPSNPRGPSGAQVAKVFEQVNYEDGVIANREVVKTTTGSVTILAFAEGQSFSGHTASFDALVQDRETGRSCSQPRGS